MELYDLKRDDVPGAVALYREKRGGLGSGPARDAIVHQLLRLQRDQEPLRRALRAAFPGDFPPAPN